MYYILILRVCGLLIMLHNHIKVIRNYNVLKLSLIKIRKLFSHSRGLVEIFFSLCVCGLLVMLHSHRSSNSAPVHFPRQLPTTRPPTPSFHPLPYCAPCICPTLILPDPCYNLELLILFFTHALHGTHRSNVLLRSTSSTF